MPTKPSGKPNGRPPQEINWGVFEELCQIQCTQSEIASVLRIHIDTLRDRAEAHYKESYSNIVKRHSEDGKCSLRRAQFKMAQSNTTMSIWLGKQYLDQKDEVSHAVAPETAQHFANVMQSLRQQQCERKSSQPSLPTN